MKTLAEVMKEQPAGTRRKVQQRFTELVAQEMTIRELRRARKMTQSQLARKLGIQQEQVSRAEKRVDLRLSTLQRSIEAMGGKLTLIAQFPDEAPVKLTGLLEKAS